MLKEAENISVPVDLELKCSYAEFVKWLNEYPVQVTTSGNKLKLQIDDIGKFIISFEYELKIDNWHDPMHWAGDGFTFDVITANPLHISGFYQYLFNTREHDQDGFSTPARDFLERVNLWFGKPPKSKNAGGPTLKTKENFDMFKRLKDNFPGYSYEKVAMIATEKEKIFFTGDQVRNTYRSMGEPWERGDRVR